MCFLKKKTTSSSLPGRVCVWEQGKLEYKRLSIRMFPRQNVGRKGDLASVVGMEVLCFIPAAGARVSTPYAQADLV